MKNIVKLIMRKLVNSIEIPSLKQWRYGNCNGNNDSIFFNIYFLIEKTGTEVLEYGIICID